MDTAAGEHSDAAAGQLTEEDISEYVSSLDELAQEMELLAKLCEGEMEDRACVERAAKGCDTSVWKLSTLERGDVDESLVAEE